MKPQTLSLRLATHKDVDVILHLCRDLFNNSIYSSVSKFDKEYLRQRYLDSQKLPLNEYCTILLMKDTDPIGFISCGQSSNQFSEDKYATELGFWIYPEHKTVAGMKKLVEAFYYWAKETGCVAALMGKLEPNKVESYRLKRFA